MRKKKEPKKIYVASSRRVMLVLMSLSTIYQYMYSSLFSSALGMLPVFGGAMFMSARMAGAFAHTFLSDRHKYLTRRTRVVFCVLTAITLLCSLALIALYPVLWTATPVWLTFAAVLSIALRSVAGRRLIGRRMRRTIGARAYWLLTALVHLVPLAAMAWILSANLDAATAWQLWGGFAAGGVLELYSQWRERDLLALEDLQEGKIAKEDPNCQCIFELMEAVDSYIPDPERDTDKPFLMPVEDVFSITGRGTVATGRVERGMVKVSDTVEIVGLSTEKKTTVVTGVEMFRKLLDFAEAGDNIGVLLRGVDKKEIERGQVLAKPGSIKPHTKFHSEVYVLTKEEGGRHTPFFTGYRPQFYFRTTDVTGVATLPEGIEMCMPGDNVKMTIELITPIAIEKGLRFAIREGGRTVGSGVVAEIDA